MINRLVFENLRHRKVRTALSALSIGFQVTMILAVVGLSHGMLKDSADRAKGVGGPAPSTLRSGNPRGPGVTPGPRFGSWHPPR